MRPAPSIENFPADRPRTLKAARSRRATLRRKSIAASIEGLESRTLMAVLPAVTTSGTLAQIMTGFSANGVTVNYSTPSILIDPSNPQKLVASWQAAITGNNNVDAYVQAATSTNGGASWSTFYTSSPHLDPTIAVNPPTLRDTTDITVAMDINSTIYIISRNHNANSSIGYLDLNTYSFSGNTASYVSARTLANWVGGSDAVLEPTLAVDSSQPSYTATNSAGITRTITDPYSGNVYVAWVTNEIHQPANVTPLPNRVVLIASSDQGNTFTPQHTVDDRQTNALNASPRLIVSQGDFNGNVSPGQVTIAWDDYGTRRVDGQNTDYLRSDRVTNGAAGATVTANPGTTIGDAGDGGKDGAGNPIPDSPNTTDATINVNINDLNFATLSSMSVQLGITAPKLDELGIELIAPNGLGSVTLVQNKTNGLGVATAGRGISGANLGAGYVRTTFDDGALTRINDAGAGAAPYLGRFKPEAGSLLALFAGKTAAQLNGAWTLRVTDYRYSGTTAPVQSINSITLSFGSGLTTGTDRQMASGQVLAVAKVVQGAAATGVGVATYPTASAASPNGIGPGLTLAADNTLGAYSPYQGRIYAGFVVRLNIAGNQADNTDVLVIYSDNGGTTWSTPSALVNDDNAATDGFSEGGSTGRPQFQPALAVDQTTGTLVASYLDTRFDAARARVATMVSASVDGGDTFSQSNYANPAKTVVDKITNKTLTPNPILDNQSAGNPVRETSFGFGSHQALAVSGGMIYAAWASNTIFYTGPTGSTPQYLTGGRDGTQRLSLAFQKLTTAAGPRIVSGTMGPVGIPTDGLNTSRKADGTPIANAILVNFDRPVDPSTFTATDVQVVYRDTNVNHSAVSLNVVSVQAQDTNSYGATKFKITFTPPAGSGVGTYSYIVGPTVKDRVSGGHLMDQNANAVAGTGNADRFAVPTNGNGTLNPSFDPNTLPLIVSGPYVASTHVSGAPNTNDNLVQNNTVSSIDLLFDRYMDAGTFTPSDILQIQGPSGVIPGPYTVTPVFNSPNVNIGIGPNATTTSILPISSVGGAFTIGDLNVQVNLTHGHDADLTLTLIAPDGTRIKLAQGLGGTVGRDYKDTVFDDQAADPIALGTAPFNGSFRPAESLSALNGIDLKANGGVWKLEIVNAAGQAGTLNAWSLAVTANVATYNSPDVNVGIAPNASTTSALTIPAAGGAFTIGDLNVQVNIAHAHDADLTLTLIAPDGTRIKLAQALGGANGVNYTNTVFDDQAANPITSGTAPFTGSFRPAESLSVLNGIDLKANGGIWKLEIVNAAGVAGTLNAWSLAATTAANAPAYAQTFRVGFPQQELSGTYVVNLNSDIKSMAGDALDSNHNAGVDILKGTATGGATVTVAYPNNTPTPIPDATSDGATPPVITPGKNTSTIAISDNYVPTNVTVTLSITTPFDPDLEVTLIAPDGTTRVTLINQRGQGVNTANFQGTILNDAGTTLIQNGGAPFNSGPYKPEQSLNAVLASVNGVGGINVNGTWTLEIKDHNTGNTATLTSWTLTFEKPVPSSGLGEISADRTMATFRIFTEATDNPLSSAVWTPVGPAANSSGKGRVGGIAVDPSDASGNTVFIGGASGGVWKTTNFLTTAPGGPTYIPLTSFGPTNSANIGGITVIGRNSNPSQSIVFAVTGEGDTGTPGAGVLRSMDGGATWVTLDSSTNFDANGNLLPMNSPQRDHILRGLTSYKILADPKLTPTGDAIVYMAVSGGNGGIWRTQDTGRTWTRVLAGQATDVAFDLNSGTGSAGGNLQFIYAALRAQGVYFSPNQGQIWNRIDGGLGSPLIINTDDPDHPTAVKTTGPIDVPNGAKGRIVIATPAGLTNDINVDVKYQGWLYAFVVTPGGNSNGLYMTKDFGRNWTRVRLPFIGTETPSNDTTNGDYDPLASSPTLPAQGNYDVAIAVDPTNPRIVYLAGMAGGGLIRVDTTYLDDAHALVPFTETKPGGQNSTATSGGVTLNAPTDPNQPIPKAFFNLNPTTTYPVKNATTFTNDGSGATWIPFNFGAGDFHRFVSYLDPLTGHARLIIGDDHGVYTATDDNGVYNTGIGTVQTPLGDRTGNLQIIQFYYGASQPTGSQFYGQAQDNGSSISGNVLAGGNIGWSTPGGDSGGVATDQTGSGTVYSYKWPCCGGNNTDFFQVDGVGRTNGLILASNPGPTPDPQWPFLATVNFAVNPINGSQIMISSTVGRIFSTENKGLFWSVIAEPNVLDGTQSLAMAYGAPDPNGPAGLGNLDNFLYVGTNGGHIYMTQTGGGSSGGGNAWTDISAGLSGGAVQVIVTNPNRGSHEAYAVTNGGVFHIVDSTAPGATWQNITGVGAGNLFNLTHNLFGDTGQVDTLLRSISSLAVDWRYVIPASFSNPSPVGTFPILYIGGNGGVFRSIDNGVNWTRFPDAALNNTPIQAGDGGLFPVVQVTDLDLALGIIDPTTGRPNTATSQNILLATTYGSGSYAIRLAPIVFPASLSIDYTAPLPANQGGSDSGNTAINQRDGITNVLTPVIDGFSAQTAFGQVVTITLYDLTDPTNPVQIGQGTTDAQGFFKVQVDPGHFLPDGSTDGKKTIGIQASDQNQAVGNMETVTLTIDHTLPATPAAPDLQDASDHGDSNADNITNVSNPTFNVQVIEQKARVVLYRDGVAVADFSDVIPDANGIYAITDPSAPEGTHVYTVQQYDVATNLSVMSNPLSVLFDYTLPVAPTAPDLEAADDSGISNADNNTSVTTNLRFDTTLIEPNAKLELLRDGVVVSGATIIDPTALADGTYVYALRQTDLAGNAGLVGDPLTVTVDTTDPAAPAAPDLQAVDDLGSSNSDNVTKKNVNLHFDILGIETGGKNATVTLYRDGVFVASTDYSTTGSVTLIDPATLIDGTYVYTATQTDLAGNVSVISAGLSVTIDTAAPINPSAPDLQAADDSGISNTDNNTATTTNLHFDTTLVEPVARLDLLRNGVVVNSIANVGGTGGAVTITDPTALADGVYTYTLQQTDLANNLGPVSAPLTVTIDTTPPLATVLPDLHASDDKGSSNSDNVTNQNTNLHFDILGIETGGLNATVSLYRNGTFVTSVDYSTSGQVTLIDSTVLADAVYVYTATQTDLAGNVSPISAGLSVTVDTTAPAAPTAPDLQAADDSGISNSDNNTATTANLHFDTTLIEPNAKLELLRDGAIVAGATIINVGVGGGVTVTDPTALADGVYVYTLQQTDLAGNLGAASSSLSVTIDTGAPLAPNAPDLQPGSDLGSSNSDNVTKQNVNLTFDILGIEPGGKNATVTLYRDGTAVASVNNSTTGAVSLIDPTTLADGVYVYTATQTDLAGNISVISAGLSVTVDATPPVAPTAPDLKAADDSGTFNDDNYTQVTTNLRFDTTSIEPFAKLELLRNGVVIDGATINNVGTPAGSVTITDPTVLADGTYTYTLQQYDLAGNLGPVSGSLSVMVDTALPAAPSVPDLQAASDSGVFNNDNITFITNPTFDIVSAESTAIVHLLRSGVEVNTRTGPGAIQDPGPVPDGVYSYSSFQTDLAGNVGPTSAGLTVTIDTTAPIGPVPDLQAASDTGQSNSDNLTSATLLALVGGFPKFDIAPVELGGFVELFRNGILVDSGRLLTNAGTITLSDRGPTFPDGVYTYTTRQTDLAGNLGGLGTPLNVTVDNTSPVAPNAPDLQAASDSGASNTDNITSVTNPKFDISNTETGSTLKLLRDGVVVTTLMNIAGGTTTMQDPGPVTDGTHTYSAYSIDQAGNISPIGGALQVVINTSTTTAPAAPDLQTASDSGTSKTDNLTNIITPTFDIANVDPGATIQLYRDGVLVNSQINTGGVNATVSIQDLGPVQPDGVYAYTARQISAAGIAGPLSGALSVTFDTVALVPDAPDLQAASDTGDSSTDNITAITNPTFDVTGAEAGAAVVLYRKVALALDSTYQQVATRTGNGPITDPGPLADGAYVYSLIETDAAGNISTRSATLTVTITTAAPGAPSAPDLQATSDTPLVDAPGYTLGVTDTDNITSLRTLKFDIIVAATDSTAMVRLLRNGIVVATANGGTGIVQGNGTYKYTLTDTVSVDGAYNYTSQIVNTTGTASPVSSTLFVRVDSSVPGTLNAPDLQAASDTGSSSTDNITSVTAPKFDVTGGIEAGATVQLLRKPSGAPDSSYAVAGSVINGGTGVSSIVVTDTSLPADGVYDYALRPFDVAGNIGTISQPLTVTIDTTTPVAPSAPNLQAASDSGASNTDNITNIVGGKKGTTLLPAPTFDITGITSGLNVQLLRKPAGSDPSNFAVVNSVTTGSGATSIADPGPITDGKYDYAVRAGTPAGGTSPLSTTLLVTYDTNPVAVIDPVLSNIYGTRTTTTVSRTPTFTGKTEPGVIVGLFVNTPGGRVKVGSAVSDATGAFTIPVNQAMLNGTYQFSLAVIDYAGNVPTNGNLFGNPVAITVTSVVNDYDGDGKSDLVFDRQGANTGDASYWQILGSTSGLKTTPFGVKGDIPISGDFNGDGTADLALFRPANANLPYPLFIIKMSGGPNVVYAFGGYGDIPAPADFDGDGKTDMAIYRPSTGQWFVNSSITGANSVRVLGGAAGDVPVPGDYLGTGSAQLAVFRLPDASSAYPYYQVQSPNAGTPNTIFSIGGYFDVAVPADYNGDGKTDFTVYRPSTSMWYIRNLDGTGQNVQVGTPNDIPVAGDYDGDGKADAATYRSSTGLWSINQSTAGPRVQSFGGSATDIPIASPYSYRQQASVSSTVSGFRVTSGALDLGSTAAKMANTLSPSRSVVNQSTTKKW